MLVALCLLAYVWALGAVIHGARIAWSPPHSGSVVSLLVLGKHAPGGVPGNRFLARIQRLDDLLEACPSCTGIASGSARAGAVSEAALVSLALPHRSLVLEESARTTRENFQRSGELLSGQGALGVITNRYHLARAGLLAQQEGLNAVLIPAEDTWEWSRANLHATLREAALYWPARWGW